MPAKTWDSYMNTLLSVLDEFKPKKIFEFGPGFSTEIMSLYPSVEEIESVEHDLEYYRKLEGKYLPNVKFIHEQNLDLYAQYKPGFTPDFIFVDGRNRSRCLREIKRYGSLSLLHDADREKYRDAISEYKFKVWTDEGNTVCLTDNEEVSGRLLKCLGKLVYTSRI